MQLKDRKNIMDEYLDLNAIEPSEKWLRKIGTSVNYISFWTIIQTSKKSSKIADIIFQKTLFSVILETYKYFLTSLRSILQIRDPESGNQIVHK